jgi:hypothetical protein
MTETGYKYEASEDEELKSKLDKFYNLSTSFAMDLSRNRASVEQIKKFFEYLQQNFSTIKLLIEKFPNDSRVQIPLQQIFEFTGFHNTEWHEDSDLKNEFLNLCVSFSAPMIGLFKNSEYENPRNISIGLAVKVLSEGTEIQKHEIASRLTQNPSILINYIALNPEFILNLVESCTEEGKESMVKMLIAESLNNIKTEKFIPLVSLLFELDTVTDQKRTYEVIKKFLEQFNLPGIKVLAIWEQNEIHGDFSFNKFPELKTISDLEKERPGICKVLFYEFGITNFSRYAKEMLIEQFDQKEKKGKYGVIIFPYWDDKLTFNIQGSSLEELRAKAGKELIFRIFETGSTDDFLEIFNSLEKKYNPRNGSTVHLLVIGVHGHKTYFQFGKNDKTNIEMLRGINTKIFSPEASAIIFSCETGTDDGIGQEFSKQTGIKTTAPTEITGLNRFYIHKNKKGKLRIRARFTSPKTRTFRSGRKV